MTTQHTQQQPTLPSPPIGAPAEADPSSASATTDAAPTVAAGAGTDAMDTDAANTVTADAPAAPDSPPLPTRHTAVTPGPRAARFQKLYAECLAHTLAKVSWDNFAACYPTIAAQAPGKLVHIQSQVVARIADMCNVSSWVVWCCLWGCGCALRFADDGGGCRQRDFEAILRNREVIAKLNELESLTSEAARRRSAGGSPPVA